MNVLILKCDIKSDSAQTCQKLIAKYNARTRQTKSGNVRKEKLWQHDTYETPENDWLRVLALPERHRSFCIVIVSFCRLRSQHYFPTKRTHMVQTRVKASCFLPLSFSSHEHQ
jgi:hypothetical protein